MLARERFPNQSLYMYVTVRLRALQKKGVVKQTGYFWEIIENIDPSEL